MNSCLMFSGILKLLILKGRFPVAALRSIPENDFFIIATQLVKETLLPQSQNDGIYKYSAAI